MVTKFLKKSHLVFDGAMGTYYVSKTGEDASQCEMANITNPSIIEEIHNEYINAGCNAIKTNTFGANLYTLNGDTDLLKQIIENGYNIAKRATQGKDVFVFCDIGPIAQGNDVCDILEQYKTIIDIFLSLGATNFLFETFSDISCLPEISAYIKSKNKDAFILVSFAVAPDGYTRLGVSGQSILEDVGTVKAIDSVGFNCVSGPFHLLQFLKKLDFTGKILSVMPNSGYPTIVDNRTFFPTNSEYFASQMVEIIKAGAKIIGGCCGTTPAHIRQTISMLNNLNAQEISQQAGTSSHFLQNKNETESNIIAEIKTGKKVIAVELDPPIDADISFLMKCAFKLKGIGADAITIADCPIARARVDSSIISAKLKREVGIDTIPHLTCRDRNINATKALLLGLNIEGVNNVLVVTGDPVPSAHKDEIKSVFNFNSVILANYISELNKTIFDKPFNICAALNVNAVNFDVELERAKKKVISGVNMFLTQPIFSKQSLENLKLARKMLNAKILGGIIPIISYKNACFMNSEISGITIPQEIIDMYNGIPPEDAAKLAVKISVETAEKMKEFVDGYYLIMPFKKIDIITEIIEKIKE